MDEALRPVQEVQRGQQKTGDLSLLFFISLLTAPQAPELQTPAVSTSEREEVRLAARGEEG